MYELANEIRDHLENTIAGSTENENEENDPWINSNQSRYEENEDLNLLLACMQFFLFIYINSN